MANSLANNMGICMLIVVALTSARASEVYRDGFAFTRPLYEASVQEKTATGTVIVKSSAMMGMWLTPNTEGVMYSVVGQTETFQVQENLEGNFIFLELRARSLNEDHDVRIRALSRNKRNETFCTVRVSVIDINDFNPLFPPEPYRVEIDEDTPIGSTIIYVQATDADKDPENRRFYYSFADYTNNFAIHPTTGQVILTRLVNHSTQSVHELRVLATDRKAAIAGRTRSEETILTVTVRTVNAHAPCVVVHEQQPPYDSTVTDDRLQHGGGIYAILQIFDPDSGENGETSSPHITHSDVAGLFEIQPGNNRTEFLLVFSRNPPAMNGVLNVTFEVSDRGSPVKTSSVTVRVKLYDRSTLTPHFIRPVQTLIVSESSPKHTVVGFVEAKISDTRSEAVFQYSIVSGADGRDFTIDSATGLIRTRKKLDRNVRENYVLTVAAVNVRLIGYSSYFANGYGRNSTKVQIRVQDANDHDPLFTDRDYSERLLESAPVGTTVLTVHAEDADFGNNGSVVYSIVHQGVLPFSIDPFNGSISTKSPLDFDTMKKNSYQFRVRASDRGTPFSRKSECLVTVEVVNANDSPPIFHEVDCKVEIPRDTLPGTEILSLSAVDIDRNPATCRMLADAAKRFNVTAQQCSVKLRKSLRSMPFGREFALKVVATDGQLTSEPLEINVTIGKSKTISKVCGESQAVRAYQQRLNDMLRHSTNQQTVQASFNRTSQLPNKHKPVVLSPTSEENIVVSEDAQLGSVVFRIRARDRDRGFNGKLWYTITEGNVDDCFFVDTQTGIVRLVRKLDRERWSAYNLTVAVSDLGYPRRTTFLRVHVVVNDVNDNAPIFDKDVYLFEIPENVEIGYRIQRNIWADDLDLGQNARVRYILSQAIGGNKFAIHPSTGSINVTGQLDRETTPEFRLQVTATDGSLSHPLSSTATVLIRVTDVNDNVPKFFRPIYHIRVAEDLPTYAVVFWLEAHDPDKGGNGQLTYQLTHGFANKNSATPMFQVDPRTGAVRVMAKLNFRTQSHYNITARVRDSRKQSFSICYLEVEVLPVNRNLNAPYFDQRLVRFHVKENATIGTRIGALSAVDEDLTDPEGVVGYRILEGTGLGVFEIDQSTGVITTSRNLDRELQRYYWLTVMAQDSASVPLAGHVFVLVEVDDVNDNAPLSTEPIYFASVKENGARETEVLQILATDPDAGSAGTLTYSIVNNDAFKIDRTRGTIQTRKNLRKVKTTSREISLDVEISDSGTPSRSSLVTVIVNVSDINNNDPYFLKEMEKSIALTERKKSASWFNVTRVVALDDDSGRNAEVEYRWNDPSEYGDMFVIHPTTGMITTKAAFRAGDEQSLKVIAIDRGKRRRRSQVHHVQLRWLPAATSASFPPTFLDESVEVHKYFEHTDFAPVTGSRLITLLETTVDDPDRRWFSITSGNDDLMFHVNSHNGALLVVGEPDAERQNFYNLTLKLTDGINSAFTQVAVAIEDVNDHRPTFSHTTYNFSLAEDTPPNTRITTLKATDQDDSERNRNLLYRIRGSDGSGSLAKFRITSGGVLLTNAPLDRETQQTHVLTVEVSDQGSPMTLKNYCRVIITIDDVNDHPPRFTSPVYMAKVTSGWSDAQVGVDETVGAVVARVSATDQDEGDNARVVYSISSGNDNGLWKMNPSTGEISATRRVVGEDGRALMSSTLTVQATDCARAPRSDSAQVVIEIATSQDAPPLFEMDLYTVEVAENIPLGRFIVMVAAKSVTGITYEITSGNIGNKFSLNFHSGVVSLASCLDRETVASYNLTVTATTAEGQTADASVVITVLDYNDNRPIFERFEYVGKIADGNSQVIDSSTDKPLVVRASDADVGYNSRLVYSMHEPTEAIRSRFTIDASTGAIRAISASELLLDKDANALFSFQVKVVDSGIPSLAAYRNPRVTIHVTSSVELPPVFSKSHYSLELTLPTARGVIVSDKIHATTMSRTRQALTYSISGGNDGRAFAINSSTGVLKVDQSSGLAQGKVFSLRLRASDGKRSVAAIAAVTVTEMRRDREELLLRFSQQRYQTTTRENSTEIRSIAVVKVLGTELQTNIRYAILNPHPAFKIGSTSGVVSTSGLPVDRESKESFELLVEAAEVDPNTKADRLKRNRCVVYVVITDVNDNAPQFLGLPYFASVQVDSRVGTPVVEVVAVDDDEGINGDVTYRLKGRYSNLFRVDAHTGIISVKRSLSETFAGTNVKFNLSVVASDAGTPSLSGAALLRVSVVDRATPVFTSPFYGNLLVSEDAQPHTVVTSSVSASSPDASEVYYTIEDGDPLQEFDIDFRQGTIVTVGKLDYERQHIYRLRIRARNGLSRAHADVEVEIRVTDVNDNSPVFTQPSYSVNLLETTSVGHQIVEVHATDKDSGANGRVAYSIVANDMQQGRYFLIDRDSGTIWTAKHLDREVLAEISFTVRATDGGLPARHSDVTVTVTVDDINDNSPVFGMETYEMSVSVPGQSGQFVGKVSAWDADVTNQNSLSYSVRQKTGSLALHMDPETGVLALAQPVAMTTSNRINAEVSVTDGLFTATSSLLLHLTTIDTLPVPVSFDQTQYNFTIQENDAPNARVGRVHARAETAVTYAIATDDDTARLFQIDASTGAIHSESSIDRELVLSHDSVVVFAVEAVDEKGWISRCTVHVRVNDVNDHSPVFTQDRFAAALPARQARIGDHVVTVAATDADSGENGRVTFAWDEDASNAKRYFSLDPDTGTIAVRERIGLKGVPVLSFYIRATDHGPEPKSSVVGVTVYLVTDRDTVPTFERRMWTASVSEAARVGTEVIRVKGDANGAKVTYALSSPYIGSENDLEGLGASETDSDQARHYFSIDPRTGVVSLQQPIDRETNPTVNLTVIAYVTSTTPELVTSSQIFVTVLDRNDNAPDFSTIEYRASIVENSPAGTEVLRVTARDPDLGASGQVTYNLLDNDAQTPALFALDNSTGVITTLAPLDREQQITHHLTILAVDGGGKEERSSKCHVTVHVIDVNDSPPGFSESHYTLSISEDVEVGFVTPSVLLANDADTVGSSANLGMYITDGDPDHQFKVVWSRSKSGDNIKAGLEVIKQLDREATARYELTIVITDGRHSNMTHVTVQIDDVNDNAPQCAQLTYRTTIREDAPVNSHVVQVEASDADAGEHAVLQYTLSGDSSEKFMVNSQTGQISTAAALDRESTSEYFLTASVADSGGKHCSSKIHVIVSDVNDNAPTFENSSLRTAARENTPVNSLLHRVIAHDPDEGRNGTIRFVLRDDINGLFYVEPNTGVLILQKQLDRETVPSYELEVVAMDNGLEHRMSSTATLHFQVLDVNDNPPKFDRTQYEATVPEDSRPGSLVVQVRAKSLDSGANAKLRYTISAGNEHGKFAINEDTGEVNLIAEVDFESVQSYVLTVSASDRSEMPLTSSCTVSVAIADVNDNSPEFADPSPQLSIAEDAEDGRVIYRFTATDRDSGKAGNVTYALAGDSQELPFRVHPITGTLVLAPPGVDYELRNSYFVRIVASDDGTPQKRTENGAYVSVEDVNDNRPVFRVTAPLGGSANSVQCTADGANCTVHVHESSSDSVVHGLAHLNATDADSSENGGPFKFKLLDVNEGLFYLDANNNLKSKRPLRLDRALDDKLSGQRVYRLTVEMRDSGLPFPLSAQPPLTLNVVVMKESQYKPRLTPHRALISISGDVFDGGLIVQRLHATDRDEFDAGRLRFSLDSPDDFERFVVHPVTGAIKAETILRPGSHSVAVRVSDGSLSSVSTVSVEVTRATQEALDNSISVTFRRVRSSETYLSKHHNLFVEQLHGALPHGFDGVRDLVIVSLTSRRRSVELLFSVRKPPNPAKSQSGFYNSRALRSHLEQRRSLIESRLGVQVESVEGVACQSAACDFTCVQTPVLEAWNEQNPPVPISATSLSLTTPGFHRSQQCVCPPGRRGPQCESICSGPYNPCPTGTTCTLDEDEMDGYRCSSPFVPSSVVAFSGESFAQYQLGEATRARPFHVNFRLRTFQSNSTVFFATGPSHYAQLETFKGLLRYTFNCGGGPQIMERDVVRVNDGKWHEVDIQPLHGTGAGSCAFKLTLDKKFVASARATSGHRHLDLITVTLGGMPAGGRRSKRQAGTDRREKEPRSVQVISSGFRGCLENVEVNELPISMAGKSGDDEDSLMMKNSVQVVDRCVPEMISMEVCAHSPCLNGGSCLPLHDNSYRCECPPEFNGDRCEIPDPCGRLPCKNKGVCLYDGENIRCQCREGFGGRWCEENLLCQELHCKNGGTCTGTDNAIPVCTCPDGWTGQLCDISDCPTGSDCVSSTSSHVTPNQNPQVGGLSTPLIIAITVILILVLGSVVIAVLCYRRRRRKRESKYHRGSRPSNAFQPSQPFHPDGCSPDNPPKVPQKPRHYQQSARDSLNFDQMGSLDNQGQRVQPLTCRVLPNYQHASVTPSASVDNDSIEKPPPSWQDYDQSKFNDSASSSGRKFSSDYKASALSINDQSYDWDVTDWKPNNFGVVPQSVASVACGRRAYSDIPSSPESRRSVSSAATGRSRRSHRSDALSGHYCSSEKQRRTKQLMQMVDKNNLGEEDIIRIQQLISHKLNGQNAASDSRSSSIRSSASRYRPSILRNEPLPPPPPLPSSRQDLDDPYAAGHLSNDCDVEDEVMLDRLERSSPPAALTSDERESPTSTRPSASDSDSCPKSSSGSERLPPPPSEYEIRVMAEEAEDEECDFDVDLSPQANESYSSLLNQPYEVNVPTPSVTRSNGFHPDQYLLTHQLASDMSEASGSVPGSSVSLDLQYADVMRRYGNRRQPSEKFLQVPPANAFRPDPSLMHAPPLGPDQLEMSSLSEEEERENLLHRKPSRSKRRQQGRADSKGRQARRSKKPPGQGGSHRNEAPQEMRPLFYGHDCTPDVLTSNANHANTEV